MHSPYNEHNVNLAKKFVFKSPNNIFGVQMYRYMFLGRFARSKFLKWMRSFPCVLLSVQLWMIFTFYSNNVMKSPKP